MVKVGMSHSGLSFVVATWRALPIIAIAFLGTATKSVAAYDVARFANLRYGSHDEFRRVVIDTDQPIEFSVASGTDTPIVQLSRLVAPSVREKLSQTYAPIEEVLLEPTGTHEAELRFITSQSVFLKVSQYGANESGHYRLVVDLFFSEVIDVDLPGRVSENGGDPRVRVIFADGLRD
jgi:hypothetical protein